MGIGGMGMGGRGLRGLEMCGKYWTFIGSYKNRRDVSSNMFVSVLNFLCIPQIGRLSAHGANVKRLLIPRIVLLSGLMRIEEIEKTLLTEISRSTESYGKIWW